MCRLREATIADVGFLTDVVIQATREQGRFSPDFDEHEFRSGFSGWSARQIAGPEEANESPARCAHE